MIATLFFGLCFGFIGSVPVAGPVSAIVFRCGIDGHYSHGRRIALGAALAEAIYAFLAFWGFSSFLTQYAFVLPLSRMVGGVLLLGLGLAFLLQPNAIRKDASKTPKRLTAQSFWLGFGITGLNPTLIATWTAVVTTLYSTRYFTFDPPHAWAFALGVAIGISGWFVLFLDILRRCRERFEPRILIRLVRTMGLALIGIGAYFLLSLTWHWPGT